LSDICQYLLNLFVFSTIIRHHCVSNDITRLISVNTTEEDMNNRSLSSDSLLTNRISGIDIFTSIKKNSRMNIFFFKI
jgi:hypothetical protein